MHAPLRTLAALLAIPGFALAQGSFVNWENPPLHSLEITPDGSTLIAVNTPDNRIELFSVGASGLAPIGAVQVGIDPVSARARTNSEVWVVNHISDSVSIVDLPTRRVVATLKTLDEPYDVVFAGSPQRAFVSCSQANVVQVFDPANLSAAPINIAINAEDPRALAVSPDGMTVYVAVFESGNRTTILGGGGSGAGTVAFPPNVVNESISPYGGVNPPPNSGTQFDPPIAPANNPPPRVGLIVRKNDDGQWMDDNEGDWTNLVSGAEAARSGRPVGWDLLDHDVAVIDTTTLGVTYVRHLMNICMALAVNPASGALTVVGTEATNEIRFEPVIRGTFVRVHAALVNPASPSTPAIRDLNPHLSYMSPSAPLAERLRSLGDPRGIAWNAAGTRAYVTGMGSNNVVVIDAAGDRAGVHETIPVGAGPVGVVVDEAHGRLYVHNRFDATLSLIDLATENVLGTVAYFDPTPAAVRDGRPHLYNTHLHSGLGQVACASCHLDARMDRIGWDLGDPSGAFDPLGANNLGFGLPGLAQGQTSPAFAPFHPMKGPMTTQTLQGIIGLEPHHWRGDRTGVEAFAGAFVNLQAADAQPTPQEMQDFEAFLATITFPPNPFRNFDNSLPTNLPLTGHFRTGRFGNAGQPMSNGDAQAGLTLYRNTTRRLDGGAFACVTCHTLPTGAGPDKRWNGSQWVDIPAGPLGERHIGLVTVDGSTNVSIKVPQLRNEYEKTGFDTTQQLNRAGFGLLHDGSVDSIARFITEPVFNVNNDQEVANLVAFMLCFSGSDLPAGTTNNPLIPPGVPSKDTHAAVGAQTTVVNGAAIPTAQQTLINSMLSVANANRVGLVAKSRQAGVARGYAYLSANLYQSDRAGETISHAALLASAAPGSEVTLTVVPLGSQTRIGIDRDADGFFDRDEIEACSDPADPASIPGGPGTALPGDLNGDHAVNLTDLATLLAHFGQASGATLADGDIDNDGDVDLTDLAILLANFGSSCG